MKNQPAAPTNSLAAKDIACLVHPQSNLRLLSESGPRVMVKGEGIYVIDDAGNRYLEGVSGLWCATLGFGVERLAKVAYETMKNIGYYQIYGQSSHEPAIELATELLRLAPVPMSKVLFQCSGSEANDTAVKLVWYYWNAVDAPKRRKIISRKMSYHGSTCAASSLSGKPDMHAPFGLPFSNFIYTDTPDYYALHRSGETEVDFSLRMAHSLEQLILAEGPQTIAAFWAEPVMGAGGVLLPPKGYFDHIQRVLKKYDILFVADEIICGFGRTGKYWGSQTFDLKPDMLTCAKGLSAGLQPVSAILMNERVYQAMLIQADRLGNFTHGYTYAGHPVTTAVALETLKIYEEMGVVEHVKGLERSFLDGLGRLAEKPIIDNVGGVGLVCGLNIVKNRETHEAFPAEVGIQKMLDRNARKHGLIIRLIGNRIAVAPPLIIKQEEVTELVSRLASAIDDTVEEVRLKHGSALGGEFRTVVPVGTQLAS